MVEKTELTKAFNEGYDAGLADARKEADRDFFAAAALQGFLSNPALAEDIAKKRTNPQDNRQWHADASYKFADAMLERRKEK